MCIQGDEVALQAIQILHVPFGELFVSANHVRVGFAVCRYGIQLLWKGD